MKVCIKCSQNKSKSLFGVCNRNKDKLHSICKTCRAIDYKNLSQDIKTTYANRATEKRKTNLAQHNARCREWAKRNPEKSKEISKKSKKKHEIARKAYSKSWRDSNRGLCNYYFWMRYTQQLKATPKWANKEVIKLIYIKSKRVSIWLDDPQEVDHIVPLQSDLVCGLHCEANLRIVPATINRHKSNINWPDMPD